MECVSATDSLWTHHFYSGMNNAPLPSTPKYQVLISGVNLTLHGKIDFAGMIKLRILRWRDYLQLSGWALNADTKVLT